MRYRKIEIECAENGWIVREDDGTARLYTIPEALRARMDEWVLDTEPFPEAPNAD